MNSIPISILESIMQELNKYSELDHTEFFNQCVAAKLKNALELYESELKIHERVLKRRSDESIIKALYKIQKELDREEIKKNQVVYYG